MGLRIAGVYGPAKKAGVKPGGTLSSISGEPVLDFVDYNWFSAQSELEIAVDNGGNRQTYIVRKSADEPIGLDLEGLYPDEKHCANRCEFCFVDQMPCDMRESLYIKDDDWRYSVLFGNYITLTNLSEREFQRLCKRAPSPLYVSVHATDPDVRASMMGNRSAGQIMDQLSRLSEAGIAIHCQVVLVPGHNDDTVLRRTLADLYSLYPSVRTVAVVPVGLTGHRGGLADLKPVGRQDALSVVGIVHEFAESCLAERSIRFAYVSDEMVERAGLPPVRYRDGEHTPQLANGVGLISGLLDEFEWARNDLPRSLERPRIVTIATGVSAFGLMEKLALEMECIVSGLRVNVLKVENRLFGPQITVAGLLCGDDIAEAATSMVLGDELLVPQAALKSGEDVFLDGLTVMELSQRINTPVRVVACDGAALAFVACGLEEPID